MNRDDLKNLDDIITGKTKNEKNVIESMIGFLSSPMAQRKGVIISAEECAIWVEELEKFLQNGSNNTSV